MNPFNLTGVEAMWTTGMVMLAITFWVGLACWTAVLCVKPICEASINCANRLAEAIEALANSNTVELVSKKACCSTNTEKDCIS